MYDNLKEGEEVSFPGLLDLRLIVEEVHDTKVRCKYYDEYLKKYVRLTVPSGELVRSNSARRENDPPGSHLSPLPEKL